MNHTNRRQELRDAAYRYHKANPVVWSLFCRFALEKRSLGYKHFSSGAIWERIRWESQAGAGAPELKMNNSYRAFYARRFERMAGCEGFFRCRIQKSATMPPRGRTEPKRDDFEVAS